MLVPQRIQTQEQSALRGCNWSSERHCGYDQDDYLGQGARLIHEALA